MPASVYTYNASLVSVSITPLAVTGVSIGTLSGFGDGTFVKITRAGDAFDKKRGADGTVDRINKSIYDFEVEFVLKRTSPFNGLLSALLAADQALSNGIFPLFIKDLSGMSIFSATQAWIKKDPEVEYADTLGNYTWKIDTGIGAQFIGGNALQQPT